MEPYLTWWYASQDGRQDVQVLVQLLLRLVHCLLVQRHTLCLPWISLKDDNVEEVSEDIGHDQVDFTVASRDVQPKVPQGIYCFEGD